MVACLGDHLVELTAVLLVDLMDCWKVAWRVESKAVQSGSQRGALMVASLVDWKGYLKVVDWAEQLADE